jgi:hypothetical protein
VIRVALDLFLVEFYSQARPVGNLDKTFDNLNRMIDQQLLPRLIEIVEDFLDEEVRKGSRQLRAGGRADGSLCAVRSHDSIVSVDKIGDFARGEKAAEIQRFRLPDIDHIVLEQLGKLVLIGEAFTGSDGNGTAASELRHCGNVTVIERFFKPGGPEAVHRVSELQGG